MRQARWIGIGMIALGCSACGAQSESDDELQALALRVAALQDRKALEQEIVQAVSEAEGSEIDERTQAKLDVIEARVDELDGMFYRLEMREGGTLKFFEPTPGEIHVAFIGSAELGERFAMAGLTPTQIYRLAVPEGAVPSALVDATERQELLYRSMAAAGWTPVAGPAVVEEVATGQEDEVPEGSVTQDHLVPHHAYISNYNWQSHCYPYGTQCEAGLKGAHSWTASDQYGYEWRYMLNVRDPNGTALGTIMTGTFQLRGIGAARECALYDDWCQGTQPDPDLYYSAVIRSVGPLVSGVGDMVVVNTGMEWECLVESFWWPGGCAEYGYKLGNHRADFMAGPNAQWHLASTPRNDAPTNSLWGNYYLPPK